MVIATMSAQGQITLPKEVRDDLGLVAGSKLMFVKLRGSQYRLVALTGTVDDFIGVLHDPDQRTLSIDEIKDAIADGGAASGLRHSRRCRLVGMPRILRGCSQEARAGRRTCSPKRARSPSVNAASPSPTSSRRSNRRRSRWAPRTTVSSTTGQSMIRYSARDCRY